MQIVYFLIWVRDYLSLYNTIKPFIWMKCIIISSVIKKDFNFMNPSHTLNVQLTIIIQVIGVCLPSDNTLMEF